MSKFEEMKKGYIEEKVTISDLITMHIGMIAVKYRLESQIENWNMEIKILEDETKLMGAFLESLKKDINDATVN